MRTWSAANKYSLKSKHSGTLRTRGVRCRARGRPRCTRRLRTWSATRRYAVSTRTACASSSAPRSRSRAGCRRRRGQRGVAGRDGARVGAPAARDALERADYGPQEVSVVLGARALQHARQALEARARIHTARAVDAVRCSSACNESTRWTRR